jgi:hypothetical protein
MEIWKPILGFEHLYEVSNLGNLKSLERIVSNKGSFNGKIKVKERQLKQSINKYGYHCCTLQKDGKRYFKLIHRLVAEVFLENNSSYKEVNHIDRNKSNNSIDNLEWCDRYYNINHYYESIRTSSKYSGVSYIKDRNKWTSYLSIDGKRINLGRFNTEEEAFNFLTNIKTRVCKN